MATKLVVFTCEKITAGNDIVCIAGDTLPLNWKHNIVPMHRVSGDGSLSSEARSLWTVSIDLPLDGLLKFKYCVKRESGDLIWEGLSPADNRELDLGMVGGSPLPVAQWNAGSEIEETASLFREFLDWSVLLPNIFVGTCPRSRTDIERLQSAGITAVVNLQKKIDIRSHTPDLAAPGVLKVEYRRLHMSFSHIPITDFSQEAKIDKLPDAVHVLNGLLDNGHRVYVHCTAGIGRSVAVCIAYLHWCKGVDLDAALIHMKQVRPIAFLDRDAVFLATPEYKAKYKCDVKNVDLH